MALSGYDLEIVRSSVTLEEDIEIATRLLTIASASHDIWWAISDPARPKAQVRAELSYDQFWWFTRLSHRRNLFIILGNFIDNDSASIGLSYLFSRAKAAGIDVLEERRIWRSHNGLKKRIWTIRCEVYAHWDLSKTEEQQFVEVQLGAPEISALIGDLWRIIDALRKKAGMLPCAHRELGAETKAVLRRQAIGSER